MTNSDNGAILEEIVNSVATVYGWKDYYQPVIKNVVEVNENILGKYAGKYEAPGVTISFKMKGKELIAEPGGDMLWKVYFTSDSDFFLKQYKADFRFNTDVHGKVNGFTANGMPVKKVE